MKPVRLPRGAKLVTEFTYDNTDANVRNRHHPPQRTVYGSNAADEMQDVYLQVTAVHPDERAALVEDFRQPKSRIEDRRLRQDAGNVSATTRGAAKVWPRATSALGKPHEAIRVLEERLKLGPAEIHSLAILGMAHLAGGDYPEPRSCCGSRSIWMRPTRSAGWDWAEHWPPNRRLTRPTRHFAVRCELAPALTDAHLDRADLAASSRANWTKRPPRAKRRSKSRPDEANALLKLAEIRTRQERYDESLHLLEEAQRLAPYTHPPKVLLAVYCFQSGAADRARKLLHRSPRRTAGAPGARIVPRPTGRARKAV